LGELLLPATDKTVLGELLPPGSPTVLGELDPAQGKRDQTVLGEIVRSGSPVLGEVVNPSVQEKTVLGELLAPETNPKESSPPRTIPGSNAPLLGGRHRLHPAILAVVAILALGLGILIGSQLSGRKSVEGPDAKLAVTIPADQNKGPEQTNKEEKTEPRADPQVDHAKVESKSVPAPKPEPKDDPKIDPQPEPKEDAASLIKQLKDKDESVRLRAAKALAKVGPAAKDAIPDLIDTLKDSSAAVRLGALQALGEMGYEPRRGKLRDTLKASLESRVAFSPDGKTVVSGDSKGKMTLWDMDTGKHTTVTTVQVTYYHFVPSFAFSPDGQTLASSGYETAIRLWEPATGKSIGVLKIPDTVRPSAHSDRVISLASDWIFVCVAFSPDGKTLASGTEPSRTVVRTDPNRNPLILWDMAKGKITASLPGHTASIDSVAFSPDGKSVASGSSDQTIRLWDMATGKHTAILKGHTSSIKSVAFSPDGKTLASGSHDTTVRLWETATGKEIRVLDAHHSSVTSLAFSPDGQTLASGSSDNTIELWDVGTGKSTATLGGRKEPFGDVRSVAFSPDGKTLAAANGGTITAWDVVAWTMEDAKAPPEPPKRLQRRRGLEAIALPRIR
jgi:WD40 repeat protein